MSDLEVSTLKSVMGEIHGYRSFNYKNGRLTSVVIPYEWEAGENKAICKLNNHSNHRAGSLDCDCGFYAYKKIGGSSYKTASTIQAIVAGRGIVSEGSRGFRAERAEIIALIHPKFIENKSISNFKLLKEQVLDFGLLVPIILSTLLFSSVYFISDSLRGQVDSELVIVYSINIVMILFNLILVLLFYMRANSRLKIDRTELEKNYPGVKFYSSEKEAVKDYNLETTSWLKTYSCFD